MKRALTVFMVLSLAGGAAAAAETWQCEDAGGHRYRSSQNVPSDTCTKLDIVTPPPAPEPVEVPQRANPAWGVEAFCAARKAGSCVASTDALERGTLNGTSFNLSDDGGVVAGGDYDNPRSATDERNWYVHCTRDKMSSARSCRMTRQDLHVYLTAGGKLSVEVGDTHFPRSQTSIKIGSKRFDTTDRDGGFANGGALVALMRRDTPIVTRHMKWPHRSWIDEEMDAAGLETALQVAKWILVKGKL